MQCTLLIPHLFWPRETADAVARGLELPGLTKLLARARADRYPAVTPEAWLCQAFEVERQRDWPIAPLTLALDGGEPGSAYWLRADPVHLKAERDGLRLINNTLFDVARKDALALTDALNRHFLDADIAFSALNAKHWYAKLPRVPQLVTHTMGEVAGKDVQRYLPSGAEGLAWHRIFTEAQMVLHEHPVNESREARGEPAINSIWFWGGGTRPVVRGRHFDSVLSDDDVALALAQAADVHAAGVPPNAAAWLARVQRSHGGAQSHLVVLGDFASAVAYHDSDAWRSQLAALEARWFAPLVRALRESRITRLTLVALGEAACHRFELARSDLLKIWRGAQPLSAYA